MRFVVALPYVGERGFDTVDAHVEVARAVEAAGLDAVSCTDHPFPLVDDSRTGHHTFDPFVLLACIARETRELGLHTHVVVLPYRNPFVVANAARTLDRAAGPGRLVLGVAAGYLEPEFAALGVCRDERQELLGAQLQALRLAWTGEPVSSSTPWWHADGNTLLPVPVTRSGPPLWIGGNSRVAIERAARDADGWLPFGVAGARAARTATPAIADLEALRRRLALFRDLCAEHGRAEPLDVCLVAPPTSWGERPADPAIPEQLAELEASGVGWVSTRLAAGSLPELLERIAEWGETAAATRT